MLTEFDNNSNYRTLENIFMAFLILLGIQICFDEYFERGSFIPDLDMFFWVFSNLNVVLMTVACMCVVHFLIVPLVQIIDKYNLTACVHIPLYFIIQSMLYSIAISTCYVW